MGIHGLWFWLLINLGYHHHEHLQRLSRRSIENSGKCEKSQTKNSFLWVMKRSPPVYFFGTIHVPYTKVWDYIPSHSKEAFYITDNIYLELDLTDPETSKTLARCQILPDGARLRDVVPLTMYRRIKKHLLYVRRMMSAWMTLDQRMMGLTPLYLYKALTKSWYKKRPIWIMLLLNALTEYDTKGRGISVLDTFLIREAVLRTKHTGSIETVEEQCDPLNALNNSQVITALNETLLLHEKIRHGKTTLTYSTKELIYHYNCGNLSRILFTPDMQSFANLESGFEASKKFQAYLQEELLHKRNKRMAKRVEERIQNEPNKSFFFAFGVGHFLGNGSIIDILQNQGYNISHLPPNEPLPRYGHERKAKSSKRKEKGNKKTNKQRRKRRRSRRRNVFSNVDNLWKIDPSWKPLTTLKPTLAQMEIKTTNNLPVSSPGMWLHSTFYQKCYLWIIILYVVHC